MRGKTVRNALIYVCVLIVLWTCAWCFPSREKRVFAATQKENVITDDFNSENINSLWLNRGASLNKEYDALHFNGKYNYGGTVAAEGFAFNGSTDFKFTVKVISGSWFAMAFGGRNNLTAYASYAFSVTFNRNSTSVSQGDGGFNYTKKHQDDTAYFIDYAKTRNVDVVVSVQETEANIYNVEVSYLDSETGQEISSTFAYEGIESFEGCPYVCFNAGNMVLDILSFEAKQNGEVVFSDDFSENKLSYTGEGLGNSKWRTNANYDASHVYVAPISKLDFSAKDSFVLYAESMPQNSNYIETTYCINFDLFIGQKGLSADVLFGVGFQLDSESQRLDETKMVGLVVRDNLVYPATMSNRSLMLVKGYDGIPTEELYGKKTAVTIKACFDNSVVLSIGNRRFVYENVETTGLFGIGCQNVSGSRVNDVKIDNATVDIYVPKNATASDMSTDFSGLKTTVDEDGTEYYDYYLNRAKWHIGSSVGLPIYTPRERTDYLMFMNSTNNSAFGPKEKYDEYIIQCDITISSFGNNGQMVGLSFGRNAYSVVTQYTTAVGFYMQVSQANQLNRTIIYTYNCKLDNNSDSKTIYKEDGTEEYMWPTVDGDNKRVSTTYNLMFVVKNRSVNVHYKRADEDVAVLNRIRATVQDVNTYGYPAIFGLGAVGFKMQNFRIININPLYKGE